MKSSNVKETAYQTKVRNMTNHIIAATLFLIGIFLWDAFPLTTTTTTDTKSSALAAQDAPVVAPVLAEAPEETTSTNSLQEEAIVPTGPGSSRTGAFQEVPKAEMYTHSEHESTAQPMGSAVVEIQRRFSVQYLRHHPWVNPITRLLLCLGVLVLTLPRVWTLRQTLLSRSAINNQWTYPWGLVTYGKWSSIMLMSCAALMFLMCLRWFGDNTGWITPVLAVFMLCGIGKGISVLANNTSAPSAPLLRGTPRDAFIILAVLPMLLSLLSPLDIRTLVTIPCAALLALQAGWVKSMLDEAVA